MAEKEIIDKLKAMVVEALTAESPEIEIEIDDKKFRFTDHEARAFGCGMQMVLKAIGQGASAK